MGQLVEIALVVIAIIFGALKFRSFFFKAKVDSLAKDGEVLSSQQTLLEKEAEELRIQLNQPVADLNPEEVEEFWKDDKK